ncbi:MAG: hypothetical protein LBD79_00940, partial [Treponema sp.]|nr:hypothetical protein [Treponema sp.]
MLSVFGGFSLKRSSARRRIPILRYRLLDKGRENPCIIEQATSNKQQATSNKQQATSNKQQATSNKQQATSNKHKATS